MIQILKLSFDASGGMVGCGALPVSFDNAVDAGTFLEPLEMLGADAIALVVEFVADLAPLERADA